MKPEYVEFFREQLPYYMMNSLATIIIWEIAKWAMAHR